MRKTLVAAIVAATLSAPVLAHENEWTTSNPYSESPTWEPQDLFEQDPVEFDALITENDSLQMQLENTMLKMLVRLMELNMRNLDEELAQCEKKPLDMN